ncbi:MFS transporter [Variovorax sp. LARHSF232]
MSTVLNSPSASSVDAPQAPSTRQMAPLLAANFAVMSANYAFVAVVGALARLLDLQAWHLGLVITMVGVLWVASSAAWGRLADRIGHAAALRRSLAGVVLAFAALALYLQWALAQPAVPAAALSLAVLLASRVVAGACTAGVPVASIAWIAGRTAPSARAAVMARYGAAGAVGMVVAPPVAGWLGGIGLSATLWLAALLPLLPLLLLFAWMRKSAAAAADAAGALRRPPAKRLRLLDARIRLPWLTALALYSVVIVANVCIGFYLIDRLGATPAGATAAAGTALGAAGLALMLSQSVVARHPQVTALAWLRGGALLAGLGFGSILWVAQPWMVAASFFVAGCGMGLAFPAVSAFAANSVQPEEQGACAAAMSMAQGASMIAAPALGAGLYDLAPRAPFMLMLVLLAAVLAGALRHAGQAR